VGNREVAGLLSLFNNLLLRKVLPIITVSALAMCPFDHTPSVCGPILRDSHCGMLALSFLLYGNQGSESCNGLLLSVRLPSSVTHGCLEMPLISLSRRQTLPHCCDGAILRGCPRSLIYRIVSALSEPPEDNAECKFLRL
jgi:hypothetical protein